MTDEKKVKANHHRHRGRGRRGAKKRHFLNDQAGTLDTKNDILTVTISPNCIECHAREPKYKCPRCMYKYCSAVCCRSHKERLGACISKIVESTPVIAIAPLDSSNVNEKPEREYKYEFPTEDTVPLDKLMLIKDDERIRSLLKSRKLRGMITKLDDLKNPHTAFREIMQDPEFRAFSNTVLEIVGVKESLIAT